MTSEHDDSPISWRDIEDRVFGMPGTGQRYKHEQDMLRFYRNEMVVEILLFPLLLVPWGYALVYFWHQVILEWSGFHNLMWAISFGFYGDKTVLGLREALQGKRHNGKDWHVKEFNWPYKRNNFRGVSFSIDMYRRQKERLAEYKNSTTSATRTGSAEMERDISREVV